MKIFGRSNLHKTQLVTLIDKQIICLKYESISQYFSK